MPGIEKSLRDVYYVPFRHKWKVVIFFCAVMVIVTVGTLLTPKSYRSDAKILVRLGRESVSLDATATTGPVVSVGQSRENEVKSELEILKSRELIEKVVDALGPPAFLGGPEEGGNSWSDGIRRWGHQLLEGVTGPWRPFGQAGATADRDRVVLDFMENLQIETVKNSNIIAISFEGKKRKLSQDSVNKLIAFYLDKHIEVHRTVGSYEFFTKQMEQLGNSLVQAEEHLRKLKNETGIASLEEQRRLLLKRIADLQQDTEGAESALASSRMKVQSMERTLAELPDTVVTHQTTGNTNQGADLMRSRFYELQLKEQDLLSRYTEQSKAVRDIRRQIAEAKTVLEKEEPTRTQVTKGVNEAHKQVQLSLLAEKATLASLEGKLKALRSQLVIARKDLQTVNDGEIGLAKAQREIAIQEANYRKYYEKLEQARIDQALEIGKISNISIVQAATYPTNPVRPRTMVNLALGLLFGMVGGIGLAFFSEYLDHSFRTSEDVEERLKLPALAAIPRCEEEVDRQGNRPIPKGRVQGTKETPPEGGTSEKRDLKVTHV